MQGVRRNTEGAKITHMDVVEGWSEVGARVAEARRAGALSQAELARRVGMERTAVVRIEAGERRITALELQQLSGALDVPIGYFVSRPPAPLASRRTGLDEDADAASRAYYRLDIRLEEHTRNAQWLVEHGFLVPEPLADLRGPGPDLDVTAVAHRARAELGQLQGPLGALSGVAERFGLYLTSVAQDAEGASVLLEDFGTAVVSSTADPGRRRWTAAHELGHHLLRDAYSNDAGVAARHDEREQIIDRFAGEFLLPQADLRKAVGGADPEHEDFRQILVGIACDYRVSWSAAVARAAQTGLIDDARAARLRAKRPVRGDFLAARGYEPSPDLNTGETGPQWRAAVLAAWSTGDVTAARATELLYGALTEDELPNRDSDPCLP